MVKQGQRGAVAIMEATFVFPIMFIIVFVMIMAGEAYFQHARVERACILAAVQGAARCENPMLAAVQKAGSVPTSTSASKVMPYRYILTGEANKIADEMEKELQKTIEAMTPMAFRGMAPTNVRVKMDPRMNILVSSFPVECSFDIKLPIRMLFPLEEITFQYTVQISEPVGGPAEFVRTVSTVQDYIERIEFGEGITKFAEKLNSALDVLARFMN